MRDADMVKLFRPCPFCGGHNLDLMTRDFFYELSRDDSQRSHLVRVECKTCRVTMWDNTYKVRSYYKRIKLLADKWNRRFGV